MLPGKMTAGIAVVHEPCWFRTAVFPLPVSNEGNVGSHWDCEIAFGNRLPAWAGRDSSAVNVDWVLTQAQRI